MAFFITLEGGDGSGKSTLLRLIETKLKAKELTYHLTREPGGPLLSEKIREILLDPSHKSMNAQTELLLYEAARSEHVDKVIKPKLAQGIHVICDRFTDSSLAYQGIARGLGKELVTTLNNFASFELKPDLTIYIKLPPSIALSRVSSRGNTNRLDRESTLFHETVAQGFDEIAKSEPSRFVVLDGEKKPDQLFKDLTLSPQWIKLFEGL